VPEEVSFTTEPKLGQAMLERAFAAGVPGAWVVSDSVYGADHRMRRLIKASGRGYVLAVTSGQRLGRKPVADWREDVPAKGWIRLSAGDGAKGPRLYDWAYRPYGSPPEGWKTGLLIRRKITRPRQFTFYLTRAPEPMPLAELVRVAGLRWTIESCFEEAKGDTGLDQYEVRAWTGWHRHITLAMLAHAYLTVVRKHAIGGDDPVMQAAGLLPFTVPEVRRLLWHLVWEQPPTRAAVVHWSIWRRRHQQRARECHWRTRTRPRCKTRL
jgi:SRSO17 transposase